MNFSQIRCFLAAADCLSFTRAADRLFLSQPVLSRQIAAMEEELGMELFLREKKSVRLTAVGEVLAEGFKQLSKDYAALLDRARSVSMGYDGTLKIGMIEGQLFCPPYSDELAVFNEKYPKIRVTLSKHTIAGLQQALESGEIDIAFGAQFNLPPAGDLDSLVVGTAPTYLFIPANHPLANRENLTLADFKDDTFLTLPESESPFIASFPRKMFDGMDIHTLEAPTIGTLALWLEAGYGIFALNGNHSLRNNPNLKLVSVPELIDTVEVIMWRRDSRNPSVPLFVEVCRELNAEK